MTGTEADHPPHRFPIKLGRRSRPLLLLFGARADNSYVEINGELDARFGFYRIRTPLANIVSWRIEGPWRWLTAIGVRRSIRHGDLTFGGNHKGGVRLDFRQPAGERIVQTRTLYVTVGDLDGFGVALAAHGIPGEDARRRRGEG